MKTVEFFELEFEVHKNVLTPYKATERIVEEAIRFNPKTICDIGTGCGNLAVSILKTLEGCNGLATDISTSALVNARANSDKHGVTRRLDFVQSDLFEDIFDTFDLICFNPPYHPLQMYENLSSNTKKILPKESITDGSSGHKIIERFLTEVQTFLNKNGIILVELYEEHFSNLSYDFKDWKEVSLLETNDKDIKILKGIV